MKKSTLKKQSEIEDLKKEIKKTRAAIEDSKDSVMIPILKRLLIEQKHVLEKLEKNEWTISKPLPSSRRLI